MSRKELKAAAKQLMGQNYWPLLGAILVAGEILAAASYAGAVGAVFVAPVSMGLLCYIVSMAQGQRAAFSTLFSEGFRGEYYLRRVGGIAWMYLFSFLWSLLFFIPGIVKSYSYALTPYLLATHPEIGAKQALKVSMKLMNGKKGELFVLDLSFLGWILLSGLTCGVLSVFYVSPYQTTTKTLWMRQLVAQAEANGELTAE
jgi:uncharacterized membrane protein